MALKDFTWFDRLPSQKDTPTETGTQVDYTPYRRGALSILGQTLSGVGAAFAGDTQWLQRQQKIDQEQYQSDLEFRAKLLQLRAAEKENMSQQKLRDAQTGLYQAQADMINDPSKMMNYMAMMSGDQSQMTTPLTVQNQQKTLADAIPIKQDQFITKKIMTSSGKPAVSQIVNPEFQKELERRNSAVKEVETFSAPLERMSVNIDNLKAAVERSPDFKPGFLSKLGAQATTTLADVNNTPWYKDYELAYNQGFLPLAQSLNSSKVLSDMDMKNIEKSLGDPTAPKEIKLKAINNIENAIKAGVKSKLKAFGVDEGTYSSIYPNASSKFLSEGNTSNTPISTNDPRYKAALDAQYTPEEIDAYLKGRK